MRITCPKCVAQYEVDDDAIPDEGREVQCARCDNIWFQDSVVMLANAPAVAVADEPPADTEIFDDLDGASDVEFGTSERGGVSVGAEDPESDADDWEIDLDDLDLGDDIDDADDGADDGIAEDDSASLSIEPEVAEVLREEAVFSSVRGQFDDDDTRDPTPEELEDLEDIRGQLARMEAELAQATAEGLSDADEEDSDDAADYLPILPPEEPVAADDNADGAADVDDPEDALASIASAIESQTLEEGGVEPAPEDSFFDDENGPRRAYRADGAGKDEAAQDVDDGADEAEADDTSSGSEEDDLLASLQGLVPEDLEETAAEPDPTEPDTDATPEDALTASEPETDAETPPEEPAKPAAAGLAMGSARPRSKGKRVRPRMIGEPPPEDVTTAEPVAAQVDPEPETMQDIVESTRAPAPEPAAILPTADPADAGLDDGPAASRKELLPDVEELDASLRSEGPKVQDDLAPEDDGIPPAEAHKPRRKSSGLRSFAYGLILIALLAAAYLYAPQIKEQLPQSAAVLDPYVTWVNNMRLLVDEQLGKYLPR